MSDTLVIWTVNDKRPWWSISLNYEYIWPFLRRCRNSPISIPEQIWDFVYTSQNTFVLSVIVASIEHHYIQWVPKFWSSLTAWKWSMLWSKHYLHELNSDSLLRYMYLISLDAVKIAYSLCISKLIRVFCFRVIAFIIIITVIEVIIEIRCIVIIFWWLICTRSQLLQVCALCDVSVLMT